MGSWRLAGTPILVQFRGRAGEDPGQPWRQVADEGHVAGLSVATGLRRRFCNPPKDARLAHG